MLSTTLIIIPLLSLILLSTNVFEEIKHIKLIGLITAIVNFIVSLVIYILFDYSNIEYQFVQNIYNSNAFNIYLGIDGISLYFILLTTFITPIVLLSN